MNPANIPIRLSAEEICAAALMDAADNLDLAADVHAFIGALEENHRLWLILRDTDMAKAWITPATRNADFLSMGFADQGRCASDAAVSAMIAINQQIAERFAAGENMESIRARVRLAHRESGTAGGLVLWTLAQIVNLGRRNSVLCSGPISVGKAPLISAAIIRAVCDLEQVAIGE